MKLSEADLKKIKREMEKVLEEKNVVTIDELREILEVSNESLKHELRMELASKEDIKHLPTKDEFYELMGKIMRELKGIRENTTVLGHQVSRNSDRIERVERKLQAASI